MSDRIAIDDVEYKISDLDRSVLDQVLNLQKVDAELQNLHFRLSIARKARSSYAFALNAALPKTRQ